MLRYSRDFHSRVWWAFASGSRQNLSAGVYLSAARMANASVPKKTLRLRVQEDTADAGKICDSGP